MRLAANIVMGKLGVHAVAAKLLEVVPDATISSEEADGLDEADILEKTADNDV